MDLQFERAEHEEYDLKRQLQALERELERRRSANNAWQAELESFYASALELGPVASPLGQPSSTGQYVETFRRIVANIAHTQISDFHV